MDIGYHYVALDGNGNPIPPLYVYAGPNQTITNYNFGYNSDLETTWGQLQGVVWGYVAPPYGPYIYTWSVVSAPASSTVTFVDPNLTNTIVEFNNSTTMSSLGTYQLMLTASSADGLWSISSIVTINVVGPGCNSISGKRVISSLMPPTIYVLSFTFPTLMIPAGVLDRLDSEPTKNCLLQPNTDWPGFDNGYPWLYLRRHFTIPSGTAQANMSFTVDNDAQVFLNGVLLTPVLTTNVITGDIIPPNVASVTAIFGDGFKYASQDGDEWLTNYYCHAECCAYDDLILNGIVSSSVWHTGDNVLAVRVFMMMVTLHFLTTGLRSSQMSPVISRPRFTPGRINMFLSIKAALN